MSPPFLDDTPEGALLRLHVQPGASRTELVGLHGDRLKVRLHARPVEGAANEELIAWLAGKCGVARSAVTLRRGASDRRKDLLLAGATAAEVARRLGLGAEPAPRAPTPPLPRVPGRGPRRRAG